MGNEINSKDSVLDNWNDISSWLEWWFIKPRLSPENQDIFDKYYGSYKQSFSFYIKKYYSRQSQEIIQLMEKKDGISRLLEIGSGCGTESLWFAMLGASVLGIDISDDRLSVARERCDLIENNLSKNIDLTFKKENLFSLGDENKFDLIWMEQAFHHIEPREKLPEKLFNLLNPDGNIVISETNAWNPLIQLQLIKQRGFKTKKTFTDSDGESFAYGVERITTAKRIAKLFMTNGFELSSIKYYRKLPNFIGINKLVWLEKVIPDWFVPAYTHFNIVLRKV